MFFWMGDDGPGLLGMPILGVQGFAIRDMAHSGAITAF